ncbi:hypothetical protein QTP88_009159 [Uroleucon formosanum]
MDITLRTTVQLYNHNKILVTVQVTLFLFNAYTADIINTSSRKFMYADDVGIKLDRTLTYNQHLEDVKNKLKIRNNISKLAGTSWSCRANVLRISALALVYSVAEYCDPVWERSVRAKKVDTQLNNTMRVITGCVRATNGFPVL